MPDHYDDYTREELIRLLRERDRKPKFGLVWERDEIEHEKTINDDFQSASSLELFIWSRTPCNFPMA